MQNITDLSKIQYNVKAPDHIYADAFPFSTQVVTSQGHVVLCFLYYNKNRDLLKQTYSCKVQPRIFLFCISPK